MTLRRSLLIALAMPGAVLFCLFFLLPLGAVGLDAFTDGGSFNRVLRSPQFMEGFGGSLRLSLSAGLLSLTVGFCVALHLARLSPGLRTGLSFVIALPLTFSGMIVAYGFILAYGRAGFVTQLLGRLGLDPAALAGFLFSPYGLAFASSYYLIPRVIMLLLPVLVNFDRRQIEAAVSLGAAPWRAHADILLPQLLPVLIGAFCLVWAVVFGAYGTALALVGTQVQLLPLQLYSLVAETGSDFPAAAALALMLTAACSAVMALGELVSARYDRGQTYV